MPIAQDNTEEREYARDTLPKLKYEGPLKRAVEIADDYGFHLIEPVRMKRTDKTEYQGVKLPERRVALMRKYLESGFDTLAQPINVAHTTRSASDDKLLFHLEVLGTKQSIAEASLLHTALIILRDNGIRDVCIDINSIGGLESLERFTKEIVAYYRKNISDLPDDCRQAFKEDSFAPLRCTCEACQELRVEAPKSLAFLTETSRQHLCDILEHLEHAEAPYHMREDLVGTKHAHSRTLFVIRNMANDQEVYAEGGRFDPLAKKAGLGRKIPAAGITIMLPESRVQEKIRRYKKPPTGKSLGYFIHVGPDAKRASFTLVEKLRRAKLPVATCFAEETLTKQMQRARVHGTPMLAILGQKEVNDDTIILRNQQTRVQRVVPQSQLATHFKRMCSLY